MEYADIYVKRIRELCKQRGIAINKLAVMSDVKQSTLDNIVRGLTKNPRVKTLHKLAIAFNMTLSEFLDFNELNEYSFEDRDDEGIYLTIETKRLYFSGTLVSKTKTVHSTTCLLHGFLRWTIKITIICLFKR